MEASPLTENLLQKEWALQKDYFSACGLEEEYWRQKSRTLWLQSGDKNTNYFHKQAEARKNYKVVSEINFQGVVLKYFEDIKKVAVSTFKNLFTAPVEDPLDIMSNPFDLIPHLIKPEENTLLTAPVTMNELKKALEAMKPDSAPSPNGFTARFFTCC